MNNITQEQIDTIKRLKDDFAFRIKSTLKIKNKKGKIIPFEINRVQEYINEQIEDQRKRTGKVRKIILKGRKQGCSTLVAGRFFDRMMREDGLESFILAHREDTVGTLYDIVSRFHTEYPDYKIKTDEHNIICKQDITQENAKRFSFVNNSGYTVGTAGKGEIGRGFTIQLLHLSEAAFYECGDKISSSIMEAVPDVEGTEIIVESTANGIGNLFHQMVVKARLKKGSYELIFIPWFWQQEYRKLLPENFKLTDEENQFKEEYKLDDEQIFWRRIKIEDSDDGIVQFRREYPATIDEAFDASIEGGYYDKEDIDEAMNAPIPPGKHKILCGLDIGGEGEKADRIIFSLRAGRHAFKTITLRGLKAEQIILKAKEIIRGYKVSKMFIDKGFNPAICEFLERDFPSKIIGVFFGNKADDPIKFLNKRAEMAYRLKRWIKDRPVKITSDPKSTLKQEMLAMKKKVKLDDPNAKLQMISKNEIKEKIGISTDELDALMLTFAYYVEDYEDFDEEETEEDEVYHQGCKIAGY